jgi:Tfp pilus assembly protein PilN
MMLCFWIGYSFCLNFIEFKGVRLVFEKEINFIDSRKVMAFGKYKRFVIKGLPFFLIASFILVFFIWVQRTADRLEIQSAVYQEEYNELERRIKASDEEKKVRVEASGKVSPERKTVIDEILKDRKTVTDIKSQLLQFIPEKIFISGIRITEGNQMNVDFISPSSMDTLRLVLALNNSGVYEQVPLPNLRLSGEENTINLNLRLMNR